MDSRPEGKQGVITVNSPDELFKQFSTLYQRAGSPINQSFYFEYVRGDRHDFLRIFVDDKDKLHALYATEGLRAATNYLKEAVAELAVMLDKKHDGLNQIDIQIARHRMAHDEPLDSFKEPIERLEEARIKPQPTISRFGLFGKQPENETESKPTPTPTIPKK